MRILILTEKELAIHNPQCRHIKHKICKLPKQTYMEEFICLWLWHPNYYTNSLYDSTCNPILVRNPIWMHNWYLPYLFFSVYATFRCLLQKMFPEVPNVRTEKLNPGNIKHFVWKNSIQVSSAYERLEYTFYAQCTVSNTRLTRNGATNYKCTCILLHLKAFSAFAFAFTK